RRGEVVAECRSRAGAALEPFRGKTAVITLPHAVWKAGSVRIVPLVREKQEAVERLEAGQGFKIALRFRESFWGKDSFVKSRLRKPSGMEEESLNFVHSEEADVPVWWTQAPARVPLLTGWAGGPKAEVLLDEDESTRVDRSLDALAQVFAVPRRILDDI